MYDLNLIDFIITIILALSMPMLVNLYLKQPHFSANDRQFVILGGILWMAYVLVSETFSAEAFGVHWLDARYHAYQASQLVAYVDRGDWTSFWEYFRTGNRAYEVFTALIMSTGASMYSPAAVNGWLAFWGGLVLASSFATVGPFPRNNRIWLILTIFFPSTVFWCTMNLKEGLMYWSICNVFSLAFVIDRKGLLARVPFVLAAVAVGTLMRPHVITGWLAAVAAVSFFQSRRRAGAVIVLLCLPIAIVVTKRLTGVNFSTESLLDVAETQVANIGGLRDATAQFEYTVGKPIFFVSGFISAFFRPFPWKINSLKILLQFLETWGMTVLIVVMWWKADKTERQTVLRLTGIQVAILASIWLCLLLTYFPNEGLMVRQRVQMIPGLLALAILPVLVRQAFLLKRELQRLVLDRPPGSLGQSDLRNAGRSP